MDGIGIATKSKEIQEFSFWFCVFFLFMGALVVGPSNSRLSPDTTTIVLHLIAIIELCSLAILMCSNIVLTVATGIAKNKILVVSYTIGLLMFISLLFYGIYHGVSGNMWAWIIFSPAIVSAILSLTIRATGDLCPDIQRIQGERMT